MTYPAEVLADSPVLYYKLDESSGTTCADSSSNTTDATYAGTPLNGLDLGRAAIHPDSAGSVRFNVNDLAGNRDGGANVNPVPGGWPTDALSVEYWIEGNFSGSTNDDYICSYASAADADQIEVRESNVYQLEIVGTIVSFAGEINPGGRRHVVITWDGVAGEAKVYQNGVLRDTQAAPVTTITAGGGFNIATSSAAGGGVGATAGSCRVSDVAVYAAVLNATRVAAHFAEVGVQHPLQLDASLSSTDNIPPVIGARTPAAPGPLTYSDSISFTVTEESDTLVTTIMADFGSHVEAVYVSGAYQTPYTGTALVAGNVTTYDFSRSGGWSNNSFTLDISASDADNTATASDDYTVDDKYPPYMEPFS